MIASILDSCTVFGFWPKRPADISLDALLGGMLAKGVDRACTLSARGIFYDFIDGNRETLQVCRERPGLIPAGTLNPARWLGCLDEARRLLDEGVRLFRFFPQFQEWAIAQAPFRKLLDLVLAPAGAVLMLPAALGITAIGRLAAACPNPLIIESFRYDRLAEALVVMQAQSNVYIETHLINSPNFVELLRAEGYIDRLVFGSNAPLSYLGAAVEPIRCAAIIDAERQKIFGGNLRRLLEAHDEMH
jgi:hypothetical protein